MSDIRITVIADSKEEFESKLKLGNDISASIVENSEVESILVSSDVLYGTVAKLKLKNRIIEKFRIPVLEDYNFKGNSVEFNEDKKINTISLYYSSNDVKNNDLARNLKICFEISCSNYFRVYFL